MRSSNNTVLHKIPTVSLVKRRVKPSAGLIGLIRNKTGPEFKPTRVPSPTAEETRNLPITALMEKDQDDDNGCSRSTMPIANGATGPEESQNDFQPRFHCQSLGSMETPSRRTEANGKSRIPRGSLARTQLTVYGFDSTTDYQKTFSNSLLVLNEAIFRLRRRSKTTVLRDFEGLVNNGQMVLVLGKPGSGCMTLLKFCRFDKS